MAAAGHRVSCEETGDLCVLGAGEKVEVRCKLESMASVVKYLGVQRDFLVGFEVRGFRRGKDIDSRFLLLSVCGFVGCCCLSE